MSPITRSKTSPRRWLYPVFPTLAELDDAFLLAVSRIQQDAQKLLGAELTVLEIRQKLYNSQSQEFWLVNNFDALQEVMYYKMKKNLFTNYKDQLTAAGIEVTKKVDTMQLLIKTIIDDNNNSSNNQIDSLEFSSSSSVCSELNNNEINYSNISINQISNSESGCSYFGSTVSDNYTYNNNNGDDDGDGDKNGNNDTIELIGGEQSYTETHHKFQDYIKNFICNIDYSYLKSLGTKTNLFVIIVLIIIFFNEFGANYYYQQFTTGHHQHKMSLNNVQLRDKVKEQVIKYAEKEISKRTHNLANNNKPNDLIGLVRTQISEIVHGSSTDYALFTSGAQIISQLTSRVYQEWPRKMHQKLWGYLTHQNIIKSREPDVVLKPNTNVGECWCFNGTKGQIAIKLSRNIVFTQLALYHIGKNVSIDPISSVPKDFELWGLPSDNEEDVKRKKENDFSIFLGQYQYDLMGKPLQIFHLPKSISRVNNKRIQAIMMKVLNNHENPRFTCLYRLQVHGLFPQ
nr:11635_t:CDS:2 [Entrophospora candida]